MIGKQTSPLITLIPLICTDKTKSDDLAIEKSKKQQIPHLPARNDKEFKIIGAVAECWVLIVEDPAIPFT